MYRTAIVTVEESSIVTNRRAVLLGIATGTIVLRLVASYSAHGEGVDSSYLSLRKSGIAQAEEMVLQHIAQSPKSVTFRKIRYYEHHSTVNGRRVLTAQAICGQIKTRPDKGVGYHRFLSWVFLDPETGRYNEEKYVVAVHDPAHPDDLYVHYHSSICSNSEDGASTEAQVNVSSYQ